MLSAPAPTVTFTRPIQVLVADDHPIIRQGLAHFFSQYSCITLTGLASNGQEVLTLLEARPVDILLLDIRMPELDGIKTCHLVAERYPLLRVIAFSMFDDEGSITAMRMAGASGYLLKDSDGHEMLQAIRAVYEGGEYYCKAIRSRISSLFMNGRLGPAATEQKSNYDEVELGIIRLICEERTSKEIADELNMSSRTVEHYKNRIREKMGVQSTVGIALYATNNWLLKCVIGLACFLPEGWWGLASGVLGY